ncbi:MAG: Tad domain-containing protein [Anaerolineales bacterium]|nr:Tad domain-containing protein [Anaerolineales bacterium]
MEIKVSERGQALVMIVLAIIGLMGITGLTIDGGAAYMDRRHAQNSADAAVMASALAKIRGQNIYNAALNRAADNGYDNDGVQNSVIVNSPPATGCKSNAGPYVGNNEYIQVIIKSNVDATFGQIIGVEQLNNCVEAIARAKPGTTDALFGGAGIVTLKPDGDKTFFVNGNATLVVKKSGAFVNSDANCAMYVNGNIDMKVDTAYQVVGTFCKNGNVSVIGPVQKAAQMPYPPTVDIPAPSINCTETGYKDGNTYYPGTWDSKLLFNGNGDVTMMPGNYCLNDGALFNGNVDITASGISVRLDGGEFKINGNSTFTCNNAVFYSNGGSGFHFNGNGDNNCTNVIFYAETGDVTWNGNVSNTFTAPTSGPNAGLLLYMPYGNTAPLKINGNSGNHITGTILAVQSDITINGNSGTEVMDSQVIGYTIKLNGNGKTFIDYDDSENLAQPQSPTIELSE